MPASSTTARASCPARRRRPRPTGPRPVAARSSTTGRRSGWGRGRSRSPRAAVGRRPPARGVRERLQGWRRFGPPEADVAVVDGLLLALAPSAFRLIDFDADALSAFHGYDTDYCLLVRPAGHRVRVVHVDYVHEDKGGIGDSDAFERSAATLLDRWPRASSRSPPPAGVALYARVHDSGGEQCAPPDPGPSEGTQAAGVRTAAPGCADVMPGSRRAPATGRTDRRTRPR